MSDRFSAQIWIGGQFSRTARLYPDDTDDDTTILQGLIDALSSDGASHEYGDACIEVNCPEKDLGKYLSTDGKLLHLKNAEAANGEFAETEQFCIDHGIPFDRNSDHFCEYDGENVRWRPGMNAPQVTYADANGHEIVDGETVRAAMEQLDLVLTLDKRVPATWAMVEQARSFLHDACPELPPELEVFNLFT